MMREKKSQEGTEEGPRTFVMAAANMSWTAASVGFNKMSLIFFYLKGYIFG